MAELTSLTSEYHPAPNDPAKVKPKTLPWEGLLEEGAKFQFGPKIILRKDTDGNMLPVTKTQLEKFQQNLSFKVVHREPKPKECGRSVVDITTKKYTNDTQPGSEKSVSDDKSKVTVRRSTGVKAGRQVQFSTTEGVKWGINSEIGVNVLATGAIGSVGNVGGSFKVGGFYSKEKSTTTTTGESFAKSLEFTYHQEEELSIPPGKTVHVKLTTYSVSYKLHYTLEISIPKRQRVFVSYNKPRLFGLFRCRKTGSVHACSMLRTLDGFREDRDTVYFTQDGFLSWVGESCDVEKTECNIEELSM